MGYASDPAHPFQEARANSWATGTNPAVRSIYSRLLAANPAIRGRAFNFGSHGATVRDSPSQVRKATLLKTKPERVGYAVVRNDDAVRRPGRARVTRATRARVHARRC